jgi:drug/metabolite transporter (DMT)-like permease
LPPLAIAFALTAALFHATWNLLLARSPDTNAAMAVAMLVGSLVILPLALLRWRLDAEAIPFVAVSAVLELTYFWMLARAYRQADLSLVYPIARGLAPVFVLVGSVLIVGQQMAIGGVAGVLLVAVGVVLVRGLHSPASRRDVAMAVGIAVLIASYTLVDQRGVSHADALTYLLLIVGIPAVVYAAVLVAGQGGAARFRAAATPGILAGGIGVVAAYGLVLAALAIAPAAGVSALRETSIVMATILAAVVLKERVERSRWLGSIVVVAGIALVVTS